MIWLLSLGILGVVATTSAQCPWQREIQELQVACLCAYNLGHELSVQCDQVIYRFEKFEFVCICLIFCTQCDLLFSSAGRFPVAFESVGYVREKHSVGFALYQ